MAKTNKKELSSKQQEELIKTLKDRFEKNNDRQKYRMGESTGQAVSQ